MPEVIVRAEIPSKSGLVVDKFTNTFSFSNVPDLGNATLDALLDSVGDFYRNIPGGALIPLTDLYSPEVDNTASATLLKAYDATGHLDGLSSMGAPVRQGTTTFTAATGAPDGLPAEVAFCVTMETATRAEEPVEVDDSGDPGLERDRPMQRHTGRVFLGPLNVGCLSEVFGQVRPGSNLMDTANLAIDQLATDAFVNAGGSQLSVWSRRDATMRPVEFVSCDNAFDVIRSRGPKSTLRDRINV